jgi:ribosomal protein S18 acetylase RimI-like enzyme
MTVRPAARGDVPRLAALHTAAWRAAFAGILPGDALAALSVEEFAARWSELLAVPDRTNLVAETAGAGVVGFVAFGPARAPLRGDGDADGEVYGLYVDPGRWGEGVGTTLIEAAVEAMRRQGRRRACLWVMTENRRARSFYEKAGLAPTGRARRSERLGCPFDEIEYALAL